MIIAVKYALNQLGITPDGESLHYKASFSFLVISLSISDYIVGYSDEVRGIFTLPAFRRLQHVVLRGTSMRQNSEWYVVGDIQIDAV